MKKILNKENHYDNKNIRFENKTQLTKKIVTICGTITLLSSFLVAPVMAEEMLIMNDRYVTNLPTYDYYWQAIVEDYQNQLLQEEKNLIKLYSDIYGLDYEKVYETIYTLTDGFMNKKYIEEYSIGKSTMKGSYVECTSKEMAILIVVRSIAQSPNEYGFKEHELDTQIEYESDLDYAHQIAYVSNVVGVDPALNYAICKVECGFNSYLFRKQNNPSGIRFHGEFATFPSSMAGFIEQALELLKYKIDGVTTITGIGSYHAPLSDPANSNWASDVTRYYNDALKKYDQLFTLEEELEEAIWIKEKTF